MINTQGRQISCPVCKEKAFIIFKPTSHRYPLVRCSSCGLVYQNFPLLEEELLRIYNSYYGLEGDAEYKKKVEEWFSDQTAQSQYAINFVNKTGGFSGKSVLEVGCGYGRFLSECRKYGALITGVDPHPGAVHFAKLHYGIDVIASKIEEAVREKIVTAGQFDFIFAFEVLEHLKEPGVFLSVLRNLLKPQGFLFISVPNLQFYIMTKGLVSFVEQHPEHLMFFEMTTLKGCLKRYNFEPVEIATAYYYSYSSRQKRIIATNSFVRTIWAIMRKNRYLYAVKDWIFKILDKHEQPIDRQKLNGSQLVCIAQRQEDGKTR
jgi:2-polyprenyl-3-methyl-5-hydroxy-6-metoxy-1,4-benzoquinol methylase